MEKRRLLVLAGAFVGVIGATVVAISGQNAISVPGVMAGPYDKSIILTDGNDFETGGDYGYHLPEVTGNLSPNDNHSQIEIMAGGAPGTTVEFGTTEGTVFTTTVTSSGAGTAFGFAIFLNNITSFSMNFAFVSGRNFSLEWTATAGPQDPTPIGSGVITDQEATNASSPVEANWTNVQMLLFRFWNYYSPSQEGDPASVVDTFKVTRLEVHWTC
ncbi:MAG: hypothetical protein K6B65_05110 [Bacilli bacterium]|nr:hypothetical protein [Bacilli bacterium]